VRLVLLVIIGLLVLLFLWLNFQFLRLVDPTVRNSSTEEPVWREVTAWDFADGEHPDGWGWGSRRLGEGYLELDPGPGAPAVYIVPVEHASDFVLSAEVMPVAGESGEPGCVHLMTRDRGGVNHLCGTVLCVGSGSMSVHHQVNRHDYLRDIVPVAARLEAGRWHRLRLTCANGAVAVHLDGVQVFRSEGPYPPGLYSEPYVAAEGCRVRLRRFQVLAAATAGVENPAGSGHEH
jgi:hypothetical protein